MESVGQFVGNTLEVPHLTLERGNPIEIVGRRFMLIAPPYIDSRKATPPEPPSPTERSRLPACPRYGVLAVERQALVQGHYRKKPGLAAKKYRR